MLINNHRLAIETGRFSKSPRNERLCLYCKADNVSEIDDEQHLLLQCSRFSEIRIALFDHVMKSCPRIDTLNMKISLYTFRIPVIRQLKKQEDFFIQYIRPVPHML